MRNSVDVVYIDFAKAFDSVVHSKLLYKLRAYGINGKLLIWIANFLVNRFQSVKVGMSFSEFIRVVSGIPQGSVLGPLLFLLYINDIVDVLGSDATAKLFADDVKLYLNITDVVDVKTLQNGLNAVSKWAHDWQLKISITKCVTLHLGRKNIGYNYLLDGVSLPCTNLARDLGVTIDKNLSFKAHIAQITARAHQRARLIIRCFRTRDPHLLFRAFAAYVRPIVEYCSPVWSPVCKSDIIKIESVQRRFTKSLKDCNHLSYADRLKYLRSDTLELRRLRNDLLTVYKMLHGLIEVNINDFFSIV